MGCWNGTCGLTGLPINAGDEVIAFLIGIRPRTFGPTTSDSGGTRQAAQDASGFCYPTDGAFPISLPFFGTYDDQGGLEEISKGKFWLEHSRDFLAPDKKEMDVKNFINDEVERDNVVFKTDESHPLYKRLYYTAEKGLGVGLFMVLRAAAAATLPVRVEKTAKAKKYRMGRFATLEDYIQGGLERYKKVSRVLSSFKKGKADFLRHYMMWQEHREEDYSKDEPKINLVPKVVQNHSMGGPVGWGSDYLSLHLETAQKIIVKSGPEDPRLTELSEMCFWLEVVASTMAYTRGSWMPRSGKGSQMNDYSFYLAFAGVVQEAAEKQREQRKEWGMGEDE